MPWNPKIKQTVDHPFTDPHTDKHHMRSRVARDDRGNWYVWMWDRDGVGWGLAGHGETKVSHENVQKLLNEEPYHGFGR